MLVPKTPVSHVQLPLKLTVSVANLGSTPSAPDTETFYLPTVSGKYLLGGLTAPVFATVMLDQLHRHVQVVLSLTD